MTQNHALDFLTDLNDQSSSSSVLKYKIRIDENFNEIETINLKKLQSKFVNQSVVLFIAANDETKFYIYWKSKDSQQVLSLKPHADYFSEADKDLCEFVANFLADSLQSGHLGMKVWLDVEHCWWNFLIFTGIKQNFDLYANNAQIEIYDLADSRDYNLLLLASESGNEKPIETLLKYGIEPQLNLPTGKVTAQDLAWKGRHSNVMLKLFQANLPFPPQFDINECSEELKQFIMSGKIIYLFIFLYVQWNCVADLSRVC